MKARKLGLVAVLIFFSASTPRSSYAQDSYFGDWSGVASFTETVYQNGQVVSVTTGSNIPATFGFDYYPSPQISSVDINTQDLGSVGVYGYDPQSLSAGGGAVSGTIIQFLEFSPSVGNFDAFYLSILSDGQLVTTDQSAVADITLNTIDPSGNGDLIFISFQSTVQTVPEPSSIVPAAIGLLMVGALAWMRCRPRLRSGLS